RIAEMTARGEKLRSDDQPEVLHRRLLAYRDQTAPLVTYYRLQSQLRTVDGMAPVEEVAQAIDAALRAQKQPAKAAKKAPPKTAKPSVVKSAGKGPKTKAAVGKKAVGKVKPAKAQAKAKT